MKLLPEEYKGFLSDCKVLKNIYYDVEFQELHAAFNKMAKIFKNIHDRNVIGRSVVPKSVFDYLSLTDAFEKYPYEFYRTKYGKYECYIQRVKCSYSVSTLNFDIPYSLIRKYKKKGAVSERFDLLIFPGQKFENPLESAKECYLNIADYMISFLSGELPL